MLIPPKNKIILLQNNLQIDNKNQLTFANEQAQLNYFNNLAVRYEYENITYIRANGFVRVNASYDELIKYNYCMYKNEDYTDKWIFAYISNIRYLSSNSSEIYLVTDSWQTYQFDINILSSFVEREHIQVSNDIPGANLIPEGLEIGEPIINGTGEINLLNPMYVIAYAGDPVEDKVILPPTPDYEPSHSVNGVQNGVAYYVSTPKHLATELKQIKSMDMLQKVMAIFTVPALAVLGFETFTNENLLNPEYDHGAWIFQDMNTNGYEVDLIANPTTLDSYNPRNKKLLTYPYLYLAFTAPNGNNQIYKYENFTNRSPKFSIRSEINPNPSIYFIPKNYKKDPLNVPESGILQGYPSVGFMTDYYNSWLAQNEQSMNIELQRNTDLYAVSTAQYINSGKMALVNYGGNLIQDTILTLAAGLGIGKGVQDTANLQQEIFNLASNHERDKINYDSLVEQQLALKEAQKLIPNNANLGNNSTLLGYNLLSDNTFTRFSIREEFAKRIDDFFDMYGYATNELKIPNIANRPNWNYVKTAGCNISIKQGKFIPQNDLQNIKQLFNNGVTFWHNPQTFLDYTQNNRS